MFKVVSMFLIMIVLGLVVMSLTSCNEKSPACSVQKVVGTFVTDEIALQLNCKNKSAIGADVDAQLAKLKLCQRTETQSVLAGLVCRPLIDGLMGGALQKLPSKWECSGDGPLAGDLKKKLLDACEKAF